VNWLQLVKRLVGGIVLLLACISLLLLWVVATPSGTAWMMNRVKGVLTPDTLQSLAWQSIDGTLLDGISLSGLDLVQAGEAGRLDLHLGRLAFTWQPWELRAARVHLTALQLESLDLAWQSGTPVAPAEPLAREALQALLFSLPVGIRLDALTAASLAINVDGTPVIIEELAGNVAYSNETLQVRDLVVRAGGEIPGNFGGSITLDRSLGLEANLDWQATVAGQSWQGNVTAAGDLGEPGLDLHLQAPVVLHTRGSVVPGIFAGTSLQLDLLHEVANADLGVFGQPGIVLSGVTLSSIGDLQRLAIDGSLAFDAADYNLAGRAELALAYGNSSVEVTRLAVESDQAGLSVSGTVATSPLDMQLDWNLAHLDLSDRLPRLRTGNLTGGGSINLHMDDAGLDADIGISAITGTVDNRPLALSGSVAVVDGLLDSVDLQAESDRNRILARGAMQPAMDLAWEVRLPALGALWDGMLGEIDGSGTLRGSTANPEVDGNLLGSGISIPLNSQTLTLDRIALDANYVRGNNDLAFSLGTLKLESESAGQTVLLASGEISLGGSPQSHRSALRLDTGQDTVEIALQGGMVDGAWAGQLTEGHADSRFGIWDLQNDVNIAFGSNGASLDRHCWQMQEDSLRICLQAGQLPGTGIDASILITDLPLAWLNITRGENGETLSSADLPAGIEALLLQYDARLPPALQIAGVVDLEAGIEAFRDGAWARLNANLMPRDVAIAVRQDTENELQTLIPQSQRFVFHDTSASVTGLQGAWQGELGFQVSRDTELGQDLQGGFSASGSMDARENMDAILDFDFNDLAWLETLVPGLRNPQGTLFGSVQVGGNLKAPLFTTMLELAGGSFSLPGYGLVLQDVGLELESPPTAVNNNELVLTASARSGNGELQVTANLQDYLTDQRRISARISGTDFAAFNADYARIVVSPRLELQLSPDGIDAGGELLLDDSFADLAALFGDAGNNAVGVSRDAVVVEDNGDTRTNGNEVPLTIDVTLNVGEAVKLGGFGLDVSLNGMLALEQEAGRSLLAYGELAIPRGSYEIYNQQLNARDGRLLFFGNPANPVIDIRAFRETRNGEVGMLLSGPVNNIQGELYSSPALPESEILSLLVTGKSFNNVESQDGDALLSAIANFGIEKGQGLTGIVSNQLGLDSVSVNSGASYRESSLGIGKYITPRLLLQYEVGLFDRQNVLSIDYTLTDNLKLEVRTGISQSVDISYTIEKD
jgi:translocation and assembly module TamB